VPNKYSNKMIHKPWGFEYLFYENYDVAIWCLHITEGQETSLHCHPNKKTGLIMMEGQATLSFLNDKVDMKPLDRHILRNGLFHSTKAVGGRTILLEIETPPNKEDIVRFDDKYGREDQPIEGEREMTELPGYYPKLNHEECNINNYIINIESFPGVDTEIAVIAVLSGGLSRLGDTIVGPGDVGLISSFFRLAKSFKVAEDTELMTICVPQS